MTVEKLTITYEQKSKGNFTGRLQALFNPSELGVEQQVTWAVKKPADGVSERLEYRTTDPATLSISLFFDTYEPQSSGPGLVGNVLGLHQKTRPASVVPYIQQVQRLIAVDPDLHRPPLCKIRWGAAWDRGAGAGTLFVGVLTSMSRRLLLFLEDGTPVRATIACTFTELKPGVELRSPDVAKKYTVMPRDTLSSIAARLYGDPSMWREIAAANGIDNPRHLSPGRVLMIPKVG